jgi:CRISPR-associated protein (TIGR03986 family)
MVFSKAFQKVDLAKAGLAPEKSQEPSQEAGKPSFHNPYNFVPALPRNDKKVADTELGDHLPVGHHAYLADYWTGSISVKLKTKTPLLLNDASRVEIDENGHKTFPMSLGADGRPHIASTSIKGMLRSAYEIVTNSRLSIFTGHDDCLAYRNPPSPGNGRNENKPVLIPAIVVGNKPDEMSFKLLKYEKLANYGYAIKLPRYRDREGGGSQNEVFALQYCEEPHNLPVDGNKVWVIHNAKGVAEKISPWSETPPDEKADWKTGWVCITGENINKKRYERVFVEGDNDREIPVSEQHKQIWKQLICNYKKTNTRGIKKRDKQNESYDAYLGSKPGETAFSQHIWKEDSEALDFGTLCYVTLDSQGDITTLSPVTISRQLYSLSPDSLLDDALKLRPATSLNNLSPVERVFGWANQKGSSAYKGQLRIKSVQCDSSNAIETLEPPVPLAILSSPKPEQARFYVAQDTRGKPLSEPEKGKGYSMTSGIRGRKVYPHHLKGLQHQEWKRTDNKKDDQNFSTKAWVKQGQEFTVEIQVNNLSSVELGALLWILDLGANYYHRLGAGKPLGFGSIQVEIDWGNTALCRGKQLKAFYENLAASHPKGEDVLSCVDLYKKEFCQAYGPNKEFNNIQIIQAFCQAANGFDDNLPIHYPRLTPEKRNNTKKEDNPIFDWFGKNESVNQATPGSKIALPPLWKETGLPYDPTSNAFVRQEDTGKPTKKKR